MVGALKKYNDVSNDTECLSKAVVDCFFSVHKELGAGYLEAVYEEALREEFQLRGLSYAIQKPYNVIYKGKILKSSCRIDLIVEDKILIELKSVNALHPLHDAQIQSYLKTTNLELGFLINFNVPLIKQGIKRHINKNFVSS